MKRVLVTGATGFIGNYVIQELLKHKVSVIASSRNEEKAATKKWYEQVQFIPFDFDNQPTNIFTYFNNPDVVVDLAWDGLPNYEQLYHFERNTILHYFFIKEMVEEGCKNIVVTGTCLEYGDVDGKVEESYITNPNTAYGFAKDTLRKNLQYLNKSIPFNLNWLRLFYVYGNGQNENSLYSSLKKAVLETHEEFNMSKGQQVRDFVHVAKVAQIITLVVVNNLNCDVVNVGSGKPITVEKFVQNYLDKQNYMLRLNLGYYPYTTFEPMSFWASTDKLDKEIKKYL